MPEDASRCASDRGIRQPPRRAESAMDCSTQSEEEEKDEEEDDDENKAPSTLPPRPRTPPW